MNELSFKYTDIDISVDDFTSYIKNEDGSINVIFSDILSEILADIRQKCDLKGGYEIFDVDAIPEECAFQVSSQKFNTGKIVFEQLKRSDKIALFVCTAGEGISDWSRRENKKGDILKSYLIDLAGSVIVEAVVDLIHEKIEKEAKKDSLKVTNRYSPGYCDWDVADQQKLFSLLPKNFCGVSLNSSSLMMPIKSVSGIIGIGPAVKKNDYSCSICSLQNCIFANKKNR